MGSLQKKQVPADGRDQVAQEKPLAQWKTRSMTMLRATTRMEAGAEYLQ